MAEGVDLLSNRTAAGRFDIQARERPAGVKGRENAAAAVPDIAQAHDEQRRRKVEFTNVPHLIHRHSDGTGEWVAFFDDPAVGPLAIMALVRSDS